MPPKEIPDRWEPYIPIGSPVRGTRFIALKVPLKEHICAKLNPKFRWTINILTDTYPDIGMIVDLTLTTRYYDFVDVLNKGVDYCKVAIPGQQIPSESLVKRFFAAVDFYLDRRRDDSLIGVHCTHGVNRTGYMIARYMIQRLGFSVSDALESITVARGHPIERENYISDLGRHLEQLPKILDGSDIHKGRTAGEPPRVSLGIKATKKKKPLETRTGLPSAEPLSWRIRPSDSDLSGSLKPRGVPKSILSDKQRTISCSQLERSQRVPWRQSASIAESFAGLSTNSSADSAEKTPVGGNSSQLPSGPLQPSPVLHTRPSSSCLQVNPSSVVDSKADAQQVVNCSQLDRSLGVSERPNVVAAEAVAATFAKSSAEPPVGRAAPQLAGSLHSSLVQPIRPKSSCYQVNPSPAVETNVVSLRKRKPVASYIVENANNVQSKPSDLMAPSWLKPISFSKTQSVDSRVAESATNVP